MRGIMMLETFHCKIAGDIILARLQPIKEGE